MATQSRRIFLTRSAMGLSSAWLASNWIAIQDAQAAALQAAIGKPALQFLNAAQAADVDAMMSQIIPTDEMPGAHEAGCVYFVDRALTTFLRDSQALYTDGLKALHAGAIEQFPGVAGFSALSSKQQIQILTAMERSEFFTAVRRHTILGMLSDPTHGGNFEQVGWKLIDFDGTLKFEAPFGYYDQLERGA